MRNIVKSVQVIYERIVARLMVESKVDTFSRMIVRDIVKSCKAHMARINSTGSLRMKAVKQWPEGLKNMPGVTTDKVAVILKIKVQESDRDHVKSEGTWYKEQSTLNIDAVVESTTGTLRPEHLSLIQQRAYEIVRHELEHVDQSDDDLVTATSAAEALGSSPWADLDALEDYFLSPAEVEAYVAGMYHAAKRQRVPFIDMLDKTLLNFARSAQSAGSPATKVKRTFNVVKRDWLEYAKKRFPKAVVQH